MNNAKDSACNCKNPRTEKEAWQVILDPAFCDNTGAADCLAHLLFALRNAIASGPEGSTRAIDTLQDGIRMIWPYTEEHKLAFELYEIYLAGDLKPWDEPRQLLESALESFRSTGKDTKPKRIRRRSERRQRDTAKVKSHAP